MAINENHTALPLLICEHIVVSPHPHPLVWYAVMQTCTYTHHWTHGSSWWSRCNSIGEGYLRGRSPSGCPIVCSQGNIRTTCAVNEQHHCKSLQTKHIQLTAVVVNRVQNTSCIPKGKEKIGSHIQVPVLSCIICKDTTDKTTRNAFSTER